MLFTLCLVIRKVYNKMYFFVLDWTRPVISVKQSIAIPVSSYFTRINTAHSCEFINDSKNKTKAQVSTMRFIENS